MDLLRDASFENRDGEIVRASMDGKVTALYFSAGWCPPCRKFTPLLKDFHDELEKRKAPFQIVFISFDKSEEEMRQYMKQTHGNWLALQFGDPVLRFVEPSPKSWILIYAGHFRGFIMSLQYHSTMMLSN